VTIFLQVHPKVELIRIILGWGSEVLVVEPETLKLKIYQIVQQVTDNYKHFFKKVKKHSSGKAMM
jgi:predicted DNA-binding transcriptional regulator YafY